MEIKSKLIVLSAVLFLFLPIAVFAHQPFLETESSFNSIDNGLFFGALQIPDPSVASQAVYGRLSNVGELDSYVFVPEQNGVIPLEILVPVQPSNNQFKPDIYLLGRNISAEDSVEMEELPVEIPGGYGGIKLSNNHEQGYWHEPFSLERYWVGDKKEITVEAGQNYFILVYEPSSQIGDYVLGVGFAEDFSGSSFTGLLGDVGSVKLGLTADGKIPWLDTIGLFLFMAGFVVGLGAVTVIDVHGFLGRHSSYWTESTIRAHKVTKPLIWLGLLILLIGAAITYRDSWLSGVALYQAILVLLLIVNGLFLTFYVSPKLLAQERDGRIAEPLSVGLRNKIALSFGISFFGWWGALFLLAWHLVQNYLT
ncbi:MAG TPA: hypothetical protein PKD34_00290 [Candidatus Doudnabacteria bacterium]|nr:hypothetical protein [Candidatus Doudnabacteria bacterium]